MEKFINRITIVTAVYIVALMVMINSFPLIYTASANLVFLLLVNLILNKSRNKTPRFLAIIFIIIPFILVPVIWTAFAIVFRWDWLLISQTIVNGMKAKFIPSAFASIIREYRVDIKSICEIFCVISIFFTASAVGLLKPQQKNGFIHGTVLGLLIVAVLSGLYILFDAKGQFKINPTFWSSINRKAGVCTDPNALGIFSFLAIALMLSVDCSNRLLKWGVIISYFILGIISGSRSFILGAVLLVLLNALSVLIQGRRILTIGLLLASFLSLISAISLINFNFISSVTWIPEAIKRTLISVHAVGFWDAMASRLIFWKLSYAKFMQYPISGVGFNQFETQLADFSSSIDVDLKGWIDNPNSFYLGILAEQGILGLIAIVIGLLLVKWHLNASSKLGKLSIIIFFILLLFGPHFDFIEVSSLFGLLLGITFNIQLRPTCLKYCYALLFVIALVTLYSASNLNAQISYGSFSRNGKIFVRSSGRIKLKCEESVKAIKLSVPGKKLSELPTNVTINALSNSQNVQLASEKPQTVQIQCLSKHQVIEILCNPTRVPNKEDLFRGVRPFCVAIEMQNQ